MCEGENQSLCPLLAKGGTDYSANTLQLEEDEEARIYWLQCLESLIDKYVTFARKHGSGSGQDRDQRAFNFKNCYSEAIANIRKSPGYYGPLSVSSLLDLNESCLRSQGFIDLWKDQKITENNAAIEVFANRLEELDSISNHDEKWTELSRGLLAGNMFDWGARAVTDILESNSNFGLYEALSEIQKRPWLVDGLDSWLHRLKGPSHKCCAIFVDNSGVDVVLGVLPFARQLLMRNTEVLLCANSEPALNDTTYTELNKIIKQVSNLCPVIKSAHENNKLLVMENGQKGPCLDLTTLHPDLCKKMKEKDVDLIIIEGMGRAVHTNLNAKFTCESLKVAVIKNKWLANRLGGDIFSVLFKYENKTS